jgi:peptidoglycan/LPS O-acetylase OafA/YrhL
MSNFNSAIIQNNRLLPGIHGLRGIAALAVVLYHLVHIGGVVPPSIFAFITRDFGYSVHLFFIISAYSLMHSTESKSKHPHWLGDYFIKRFFRIAPLFYAMLFLFIAVGLYPIVGSENITNLILNLSFTFGFVPTIGIVWGGWSVGVEMIFYAIFPVLILLIKTHRTAMLFLMVSIVLACTLRSALHLQYLGLDPTARFDWSYFSFASNICFFAMGIYAYFLAKRFTHYVKYFVPIISIIIILALLFSNLGTYLHNSYRLDIVLWGLGFTGLCAWQSVFPSRIIANKFFEYLGERSFSIYLLHPVIMYFSKDYSIKTYEYLNLQMGSSAYFVCAILMSVLVLVFSEITYRFIEVPGIDLGRKLIKTRKYA